jgi:hypothetical protein
MTNYSAKTAERNGQRTVGRASVGVGRVLWELQSWDKNHKPNMEKVIKRTSSRKHYRVPLGLVEVLGLETVQPDGLEPTDPPTALVSVHSMVESLEAYAKYNGGYYKMAQSICALVLCGHKMQEIHREEL